MSKADLEEDQMAALGLTGLNKFAFGGSDIDEKSNEDSEGEKEKAVDTAMQRSNLLLKKNTLNINKIG